MDQRDIEKAIQQLKDSLPKVIDTVKKFTDIADELDRVMAAKKSAAPDVDKVAKELAEKEGHLAECEQALEDISSLMLRMDKILTTEKKTKEIEGIRKAYEQQQQILIAAAQKIRTRFSQLAKKAIPNIAESLADALEKKFNFYLNDKAKITTSHDLQRKDDLTAFVKVITVTVGKKVLYTCISMNYSNKIKAFSTILVSCFPNVRPKPPYTESRTWETSGHELDFFRCLSLMLYHGMDGAIKKYPEEFKKMFKAPPARLKRFINENDFVYRLGKDVGKGPVATFDIRPENIEVVKDGNPTGKFSSLKEQTILARIRELYPKGRVEMQRKWYKIDLSDGMGTNETVYRLKVWFFMAGFSHFAMHHKPGTHRR